MKNLLVLALGVLLAVSASAEQSKRESVEELLRITNADSLVDNMYAQVGQMLGGMKDQLGIQESEQEIFEAHTQKVVDLMREHMSWEKMKDPMIDIYLRHYSEQEIQDMLTFYNSPTGRSMVEKMPAVMGDSIQLSQSMLQAFMPQLQQLGQDLQEDLRKHREAD